MATVRGAFRAQRTLSRAGEDMGEVAEDLKVIFKVRRQKTALALAEEFVELHGKLFPKAISPSSRRA